MDTGALQGKIEFIQCHKPDVAAGDYRISVSQQVEASGIGEHNTFGDHRSFTIAAPRFALTPQDVHSVFPPPASDGEHSNVLPHMVLNRSTLAWERDIRHGKAPAGTRNGAGDAVESNAGWLALLVFHQDEFESGRVSLPKLLTVGELLSADGRSWPFDAPAAGDTDTAYAPARTTALPPLVLGSDQRADDRVTVIDVDRTLLALIMPSLADLDLLSHVRQRKTVSADLDAAFLADLARCKPESTLPAASVFEGARLNEFREALKHAGIRLPVQSTVSCRLNGRRKEWLLVGADTRRSFVAREDSVVAASKATGDGRATSAVTPVLNVYSSDAELGVVVANRLPMAGGTTTVHLVSLEGRYDRSEAEPVCALGPASTHARFVSLKHWSFSCLRTDRTFAEMLRHLDAAPIGAGRTVPDAAPSDAGLHVLEGSVPLSHHLRHGDRLLSWYHGPLLPAYQHTRLHALTAPVPERVARDPAHPGGWRFEGEAPSWVDVALQRRFGIASCLGGHPRVPDQLLRIDRETGMFDTAYAAAWQLGRMMALADTRFSVALTTWKRHCVQHRHRTRQATADLHLHTGEHPDLVSSLAPPPPEVSTWFDQRNLLKGVPFNYLVPAAGMLPAESIRFFEVDPLWTDCLLDGAFSLGRVTEADHAQDFQHIIADNRYPRMSGLLMRSDAVDGWPGLLVEGSCRLPLDVELFRDAPSGLRSVDDVPKLRQAMEALGLPLPQQMRIELSDDLNTCMLTDLDTNPDYVDTLLEGDGTRPQLCLTMPDRDRLYNYMVVNEGTFELPQLRLTLPLLRQERLAAGVVLCLFHGALDQVDVHLKPETLHFGLEWKPHERVYAKDLKAASGEPDAALKDQRLANTLWKTGIDAAAGAAVLDVHATATWLASMRTDKPADAIQSADFALQMIEGNERVRFTIADA